MRRWIGESKEEPPLLLNAPRFSIRPGFAPVPTPLEAGREQQTKDNIMAAIKQLAAVTRSGTGKGAARSVRREGRVPAVIYGGGLKPEPISVDYKDVNKLIFSGHFLTSIFELEVDGRKERVLPRDYQLDVVSDRPVHVDFLRLAPGSRVRIGVPVHVVNREASPGLKKGGAVNIVLHTVEVMAPADAIPESITIDLAGLDFHDSVHVSAVKLPEGCRPVSSKSDQTVVTIVPPTIMAEETPAAPAAAAAAAPGAAAPAPAAGAPAKADAAKGAAAAAPAKAAAAPAASAKPAAKK
jgi:large subunit ribosomal protein L25